jgi:hypothetical protein
MTTSNKENPLIRNLIAFGGLANIAGGVFVAVAYLFTPAGTSSSRGCQWTMARSACRVYDLPQYKYCKSCNIPNANQVRPCPQSADDSHSHPLQIWFRPLRALVREGTVQFPIHCPACLDRCGISHRIPHRFLHRFGQVPPDHIRRVSIHRLVQMLHMLLDRLAFGEHLFMLFTGKGIGHPIDVGDVVPTPLHRLADLEVCYGIIAAETRSTVGIVLTKYRI